LLVTCVTSKLLQFPDFTRFASCLRAAVSVFRLLNPKAAFSILPARKNEIHPAFAISKSSVERTFLTMDQPFNKGSPPNRSKLGNRELRST
jgi:hypothetical protein